MPSKGGDGAVVADPPPWRRLEERRRDPHREAAWGYERKSAWRVSASDPDATLMRTGSGTALGYPDHYGVDGGKARVVLAALVTPAAVMENQPMLDLLWRVCLRWKLRPQQVTGDTTSGTTENIVAIEDAGIRAYVPVPDFDHRTEASAKARRKRQVWVEPLFAEAKAWHGLRRFRLRGLEKVNGAALLIAAGQNLKRLLSHRGWGRRPFPSGAAGAVAPSLPHALALTP